MRLTFLFSFFLFPILLPAQPDQPEPVLPITRVVYPVEYYETQADLWAEITRKSPKRTDAWFHYYRAARNAFVLSSFRDWDLPGIVEEMGKYIPNTFEYHYCRFAQSDFTDRSWSDLLHAYELDSQRPEGLHSLMTYYEQHGDPKGLADACRRWYESGDYSPGVMDWNYNLLAGLEPDALLLTHGDLDTYPSWMLQQVHGFRQDVRVLNVHLFCQISEYRNRLLNDMGLPPLDFPLEMSMDQRVEAVVNHLAGGSTRPLYLAATVHPSYRQGLQPRLFLTGLAFLYAESSVANVPIIRQNWEERFHTDQLSMPLLYDISSGIVNSMNLNYLPSMFLLHEHYQESGESSRAEGLRTLALKIGERGGQQQAVRAMLEESKTRPEPLPAQGLSMGVRDWEKHMKPVGEELYACDVEVTVGWYEEFLMDLLRMREYGLLEKCMIRGIDWREVLPENVRGLQEELLFEHGHPDDKEMPVQNISHEAAQAFCRWLTDWYNQQPQKERRLGEVCFRLPTAEEWEAAARGGIKSAPYPWGGYYARNSKGCYLGSFNPALDTTSCRSCPQAYIGEDGGYLTVPVESYFPNNFGLYNCSGNVAEMVQEMGVARGGSWADGPLDCQVTSEKTYPGPSPELGFRVFMEKAGARTLQSGK